MFVSPPARRMVFLLTLAVMLVTVRSSEQEPLLAQAAGSPAPTSPSAPSQLAAPPVRAPAPSQAPPSPPASSQAQFHLQIQSPEDVVDWTGEPVILEPGKTQHMAQTTNGSMIFAYQNVSEQNSLGQISLASGGKKPESFDVPPLTGSPLWIIRNWQGNNLQATNFSMVNVPIRIQAVGPGIPGNDPKEIVIGTPSDLAPGDCGLAQLKPAPMQFVFSSPDYTATFAMIGGPPDAKGSNAYTFTVNARTSTALPQGDTPPPGDYSTTAAKFEFSVNWGSDWVFIANLSGKTSDGNSVLITKL